MNAHETRLELASKQRMQKTKDKWVALADKVAVHFGKYTSKNGVSLGDKIEFSVARPRGRGCINFSFCQGVVFALGEDKIIVMYRGKLEQLNYQAAEN